MNDERRRGWLLLRMEIEGRDPVAVETALEACGAQAVTLDDAGDDPVYEPGPGETPLWPSTRATGLFPGDADPDLVRAALANALDAHPLPAHEFIGLDDRTWEREWLKDFKPIRFGGRLWVVPGEHAPPDPGAVNLLLDPGLAFGTGTHPTTAMCLEWLDSLDLTDKAVVDYGCGSGILAVAAALLGAREVIAVDNDPQALVATRENAERNGVGDKIMVLAPDQIAAHCAAPTSAAPTSAAPTTGADVLVANILAGPLIELAPRFRALTAPHAQLALAGLIERQVDDVRRAYASWCALEPTAGRDGWVRLSGARR